MGDEDAGDQVFAGLFGSLDPDAYWDALASVLWHDHGGSGLSLTLADVMDLPFDRLAWFTEWVNDRRAAEAAAIKRAQKRR